MSGLLRSWGCCVVAGCSDEAVLADLLDYNHPPDVIISDYQLENGRTGVEAIARLRGAFAVPIPAFLMSGNTNPDPLRDAQTAGFPLLHKPVDPMTLRASLTQIINRRKAAPTAAYEAEAQLHPQ
jgi:CheY-like chemotaxis protein